MTLFYCEYLSWIWLVLHYTKKIPVFAFPLAWMDFSDLHVHCVLQEKESIAKCISDLKALAKAKATV